MRIKINFASREYLLARKLYVALLTCLFCLGAVFVYNATEFVRAEQRQTMLESQVRVYEKQDAEAAKKLEEFKKAAPDEAKVKASLQQAGFANGAIARRVFSWTAFLNRLEALVPPGVAIVTVQPNFQTLDVSITGTALDMSKATEFIGNLTSSPYFADIPPVFHSAEVLADKDIGKTIQSFSLTIKYRPDGSPKTKGAEEKK